MKLEKGIKSGRGEIARAIRKLKLAEEGVQMKSRITALKEKATLSLKEDDSSYKSLERLISYLLSF